MQSFWFSSTHFSLNWPFSGASACFSALEPWIIPVFANKLSMFRATFMLVLRCHHLFWHLVWTIICHSHGDLTLLWSTHRSLGLLLYLPHFGLLSFWCCSPNLTLLLCFIRMLCLFLHIGTYMEFELWFGLLSAGALALVSASICLVGSNTHWHF